MKKAFTLIELVIVITIIGILMGVTMKFWSDRIVDLKAQSLKDKFVDNYALVQSQNLASSYHGDRRYTRLDIAFSEWWILAQYDGSWNVELLPDVDAINIKNLNGTPTLSLTPYRMGCVSNEWTWITFDLEINGNKTYCFAIDLPTCKLREMACFK